MLPGFLETFAESIIKNPEYKVFYAQIKKQIPAMLPVTNLILMN